MKQFKLFASDNSLSSRISLERSSVSFHTQDEQMVASMHLGTGQSIGVNFLDGNGLTTFGLPGHLESRLTQFAQIIPYPVSSLLIYSLTFSFASLPKDLSDWLELVRLHFNGGIELPDVYAGFIQAYQNGKSHAFALASVR
jgi:hypothetical protein